MFNLPSETCCPYSIFKLIGITYKFIIEVEYSRSLVGYQIGIDKNLFEKTQLTFVTLYKYIDRPGCLFFCISINLQCTNLTPFTVQPCYFFVFSEIQHLIEMYSFDEPL